MKYKKCYFYPKCNNLIGSKVSRDVCVHCFNKIKREMDDIIKKKATNKSINRYRKLSDKLFKLEERIKNI